MCPEVRGQGTEVRGGLAEGHGRHGRVTWWETSPGRAVLSCCRRHAPHRRPAGSLAPPESKEGVPPVPLAPGPWHLTASDSPSGLPLSPSLGPRLPPASASALTTHGAVPSGHPRRPGCPPPDCRSADRHPSLPPAALAPLCHRTAQPRALGPGQRTPALPATQGGEAGASPPVTERRAESPTSGNIERRLTCEMQVGSFTPRKSSVPPSVVGRGHAIGRPCPLSVTPF